VRLRFFGLAVLANLVGPAARLTGRARGGLTPWRSHRSRASWPLPRAIMIWSDGWRVPAERLASVEAKLRGDRVAVQRGGDFDRWDLEVRGGMLGSGHVRMAAEDHPGGAQLVRFRVWPRWSAPGAAAVLGLAGLVAAAAWDGAWVGAAALATGLLAVATRSTLQCAVACGSALDAIEHHREASGGRESGQ
jgi:hypothetical protein